MVHLYLIGVFSIIFHVIIFFASVVACVGVYKHLITNLNFITVALIIGASAFSIIVISNTLKVSHINIRKIKPNLLDTDIEEEKKHYQFISQYNVPLIIMLLISYGVIFWQLLYLVELKTIKTNLNTGSMRVYFLMGTYVLSWYYFVQVLRINKLIKKYGIHKNSSF